MAGIALLGAQGRVTVKRKDTSLSSGRSAYFICQSNSIRRESLRVVSSLRFQISIRRRRLQRVVALLGRVLSIDGDEREERKGTEG